MQTPASRRKTPTSVIYVPVTMYDTPPAADIALDEFERLAMDRLKVLRLIDEGRSARRPEDQIQGRAKELFNELMKGSTREETFRKDVTSHFVLRLAFCQKEELRRWLLAQECSLFGWRFNDMSDPQRIRFLEDNDLPFEEISSSEFSELRDQLAAVAKSRFDLKMEKNINSGQQKRGFYRVPFEKVPDLVAARKVLVKKGFAYVPRDQVVSLVMGYFRAAMSKALTLLAGHWATQVLPLETQRLAPIIEDLKTKYIGPDYNTTDAENQEEVSVDKLPVLAKRNFPLCMQHLFDRLQQDHHLKYMGRMQLSLFLKGMGLSLGDALQFWRQSFAPKVPMEKFEKEYAYNIRHNYGREGKRKDYTPYPCVKVVSLTPGVGDHHGCPYKTFSEPQLRAALSKLNIGQSSVEEAVSKAKGGHFQLACASAFEGVHGCPCDTGINHPNQYFSESRNCEQRQSSMNGDVPHTPNPSKFARSSMTPGVRSGLTPVQGRDAEMSVTPGTK